MTSLRTKFYLDKQNAKWAGVCAGIADYTGVDVTVVRMGFVLGTLLRLGGTLLLAYFIIAWMAPRQPRELYDESPDQKKFWQGVRANPRSTARDVRSRFREHRPPARRRRSLCDQLEQPARPRDRAAALSA